MTDEAVLDQVRNLIARSSLASVDIDELSARRATAFAEASETADVDINLQHRISDEGFGFRMIGSVENESGSVRAAVAISYTYEGEEPTTEVLFTFGNEVAIMALFPYLREAISSITSKVFNEPLLLPVLERGSLTFDIEEKNPDQNLPKASAKQRSDRKTVK
ncbi:hypothetical protein [Rathayibacter sp. PhB152]|uniref:hypothetical protein n=1 Tax=Rathayibacter sp. PhB152 TaxID=2485190 RepID=UPI0011CD3657|nr:hypothetical protein [Rathayibacter sp. PhB152]